MASAMVVPTLRGATSVAQGLSAIGLCSGCAVMLGVSDRFIRFDHPQESKTTTSLATVGTTFLRALVVPSLLEETIWRVILQPPGMPWSQIVAINAVFSLYHVFGSAVLAEHFDQRLGAKAVFLDPAFLSLTFVLGNTCSFVYIQTGYALWASVLVHTVPVTLWLCFLGGEAALSTPGGLQGVIHNDNNNDK